MKDLNLLSYRRLLLPCAEEFASKPMIVDDGVVETYGDHISRSLRLVRLLREDLGLGPGHVFGVLSNASRFYTNLWHAALLGGGIINAFNARFALAELVFIVGDSKTEVLFADAAFAETATQLRDLVPCLHTVILIGDGDGPADTRLDDAIAGLAELDVRVEEDEVVAVSYTGGTSGQPKGVMLTEGGLVLGTFQSDRSFACRRDGAVVLSMMPMFHVGSTPVTLAMPATGNLSVIYPAFDAGQAVAAIEEHRVTTTVFVPTMMKAVIEHPEFRVERLASLRTLVYGGAPMPRDLLGRMLDLLPGIEFHQLYGATESGMIAMLGAADHTPQGKHLESVGRRFPLVEISVRGDLGESTVPAGQPGEMWIRTATGMAGYLGQPDETARSFKDGWWRSGDIGYVDEDGYVFLLDRAKDMIVTGGENVYSVEVENALSTHPDVVQVAVIGVPHDVWGEAVHAVVVVDAATTTTAEELRHHCRNQIAGYKVPKSIDFRTEPLPVSAGGKVLKRVLREQIGETGAVVNPS